MFYRLKKTYRLVGWERLPWALADRTTGKTFFISRKEMDALRLCNGRINVDLPLISGELRDLLPVLEKNGIIEPCRNGETIDPIQEYRRFPARYIECAHWSVTGRCNYRCRHCYMSAPDAKYGELDHDAVIRMAHEIGDCGILQVTLTGGEPLLRSDFLDIVDALLEQEIRIKQIYTNGALVNETLLKELGRRGLYPEFNMSFDGVGWHDWMRGVKGAEAVVDHAFLLCRDLGFTTGAEMCVHHGNKHTLRETVRHLRDMGCKTLKTNPVADTGEWRKNGYGESISNEELMKIYLDYVPQYYEDGMPLSIMLGGLFSADPRKPDSYDIPAWHYPEDPQKCCVCNHARHVLYISPEGRALPCMSLTGEAVQEEFPLIPEEGLAQCITDSRYMDFINTRALEVLSHNPECSVCPYRLWCQGGCRASGLACSEDRRDLLYPDRAVCEIFTGGWIHRLMKQMKEVKPEAVSPVLQDEYWKKQLES